MRFRPSLWLTVFSAISFVILLGLGTWQVQRLEWKEGLIAGIQAGLSADPVALPARLEDAPGWRFRRVTLQGRFLHHAEAHRTGKAENGRIGFRIFTPLQREDGETVMVERGWVPEALKDPATRAAGQVTGPVRVTGMLRLPDERNFFTPGDDPAGNMWFASDPRAMAASAGVTVPGFYVVQEEAEVEWPRAAPADLSLRNNHASYAFTWYSLALILLVIWVMLSLRRGREAGA